MMTRFVLTLLVGLWVSLGAFYMMKTRSILILLIGLVVSMGVLVSAGSGVAWAGNWNLNKNASKNTSRSASSTFNFVSISNDFTDVTLCRMATTQVKGKQVWKKRNGHFFPAQAYVKEAKRRGLSCGVGKKMQPNSVPKPTQKGTSAGSPVDEENTRQLAAPDAKQGIRSVAIEFNPVKNYAIWKSLTDFQKDEFKEKWLNTLVEVTAPIKDVSKYTIGEGFWVTLDTTIEEFVAGNSMFRIKVMTKLSKNEARNLNKGQELTVQGTIKRILLDNITLNDVTILSAPSKNLAKAQSKFSLPPVDWNCNVPLIGLGSVMGRLNAKFSFTDSVYVEFSEPLTGKIFSSGQAEPKNGLPLFDGNTLQLRTSGETVYEVNRVTGFLRVRDGNRVFEESFCQK